MFLIRNVIAALKGTIEDLFALFQGKIYTGLIGDRRIFLREIGVKGDKFRPTIEVSEAKMGSGPYVDKIVYKRKE